MRHVAIREVAIREVAIREVAIREVAIRDVAVKLIATLWFTLLALACAQGDGMSVTLGEGPPLEPATLTPLYQETFDEGKTPEEVLGGALDFGQDGAWAGSLNGGRLN